MLNVDFVTSHWIKLNNMEKNMSNHAQPMAQFAEEVNQVFIKIQHKIHIFMTDSQFVKVLSLTKQSCSCHCQIDQFDRICLANCQPDFLLQ